MIEPTSSGYNEAIENNNSQNKNDKQITLEMVQRKLESIGIIINVERLMKE